MMPSFHKRALVSIAGLVALVLLVVACAPAYRGTPTLEPLDIEEPEVALGQEVFFANCHQCHTGGSKSLGLGITNKPLPDWAIRFQVRNGIGQMPAFSEDEISDNELNALIAYLNALRERLISGEEN
ncbi:MAG: cytochrome c [Halomonas sp.]|nr:cytochrome c [Halomonas sp.]